MGLEIVLLHSLKELDPQDWPQLSTTTPFAEFDFLRLLESSRSISPALGWRGFYLALRERGQRKLQALLPMYEKTNSYGELVFDWSWAEAYQRMGGRYYPKFVIGIPYTPATGPRILIDASVEDPQALALQLISGARQLCSELGYSGIHVLFNGSEETALWQQAGFVCRTAVQYQWQNQNYSDFEDFLSQLSHKRRKEIRRERRKVAQQGFHIETLHGDELDEAMIQRIHGFYEATFVDKGGLATFTEQFFADYAASKPRQLVIFAAWQGEQLQACAICYRDDKRLYGRHWGARGFFDSLHFELCYYQGIEYAIRHRLQWFEPGAQGEYKVPRGFDPVNVYSMHWMANKQFHQLVADFVKREAQAMDDYVTDLMEISAYKK